MACLKCGRETDQTFCESCRETMEKYPVKPGAFVFIPRDHRVPVKRAPARLSNSSLEKQIAGQNKMLRKLAIAVIILAVLVAALGNLCFRLLRSSREKPLGQNYSTVTTPPDEETAEPLNEETEPDPMFHVKH